MHVFFFSMLVPCANACLVWGKGGGVVGREGGLSPGLWQHQTTRLTPGQTTSVQHHADQHQANTRSKTPSQHHADQHQADMRSTIGQHRPTPDQHRPIHRPTLDQLKVHTRPTPSQHQVNTRPTPGRYVVHTRPNRPTPSQYQAFIRSTPGQHRANIRPTPGII